METPSKAVVERRCTVDQCLGGVQVSRQVEKTEMDWLATDSRVATHTRAAEPRERDDRNE